YLFTVPVDRTLSALSLHDALPISLSGEGEAEPFDVGLGITPVTGVGPVRGDDPLFFQEPNLGDPYRRELGGQQRERGADAHRRRMGHSVGPSSWTPWRTCARWFGIRPGGASR